MMYKFERVIEGLSKYISDELYPDMNDWQEFMARVVVGRILNNQDQIRDIISSNGFIRTFGIIDKDGNVDVETLAEDIKREISRKEKITLEIPMFGKITFRPSDIDVIHKKIAGEVNSNNESY